jgi:hypothetical protein
MVCTQHPGYTNKIVRFFAFDELNEFVEGGVDPSVVMKMNKGYTSFASFSTTNPTSSWAFRGNWANKSQFTSKQDAITKTTVNYNSVYSCPSFLWMKNINSGCFLYSGKELAMPMIWTSTNDTNSIIGKSSLFHIISQRKEQFQTMSFTTPKDRIVISYNDSEQSITVPWNGTSVNY